MKPNVTFFTVLLLFFVTHSYFSQYVSPKIDAVGLLAPNLKVIRPAIEFAFAKHFSAGLVFEKGKYQSGSTQINSSAPVEVHKITGWGLMSELRYYPGTREKRAPLGVFLGAHFRYRNLTEDYTGEDYLLTRQNHKVYANLSTEAIAYNYGVHVGYKAHLYVFALELLAGFGGANGTWKTPNERERINPDFKADLYGIENAFRFEVSVGFIFPKVKTGTVMKENVPYTETVEDDKKEVAQVIIYRPKKFGGSAVGYDLYAGDKLITRVSSGTYYVYTLTPGLTEFSAKTESKNSITLNLEKGRTYYLKCGISAGIFIAHPSFEVVAPAVGQEESAKLAK
jgi:hypothetical protein